MMQILPEQLENILPLAVEWAEAKEKVILEHGTALFPQCMEDAKSVGVKYPERVRIYEVPQIPIPKHPILKAAAEATQLISPATIGLSLRYGIFIHNEFAVAISCQSGVSSSQASLFLVKNYWLALVILTIRRLFIR